MLQYNYQNLFKLFLCLKKFQIQITRKTIKTWKKEKTVLSNKIKCSHILVEKQSQALAILDRIKNGEKFGKLAKDLSTDTGSAKRDGNLGYFTKGKMVKQFEEVAFKLQIGQVSEPVKSEFGYHIIKRLG